MRKMYSVRVLFAAFVVCCSPAFVNADILGFGDFSGFTINQGDAGSSPTVAGSTIRLTNQGGKFENRSIIYNAPQSISQFTASFTYQSVGSTDNNTGATFFLENAAAGVHALGSSDGFGYSGIGSSVGVTLELHSKTGFYTGGSLGGGSVNTAPVNLLSGNPINVTLTYNGSTLHETLFDTVTLAQFDATSILNIPAAVGGATAYVGIGDSNYDASSDQYFSNFHFTSSVPEPSTLVLGGMGGLGLLVYTRCCRRKP